MPAIPIKAEELEEGTKITCPKLIIVEGKGDRTFLIALLKNMKVVVEGHVEIRVLEGEDRYRIEFPTLLNDPGFSQVTAYAYIRDADKNANSALESVQNALKQNGQPYPDASGAFATEGLLKVGIFIMPGKNRSGAIEDLCLESVQDHPIMQHVDEYLDNVKKTQLGKAPKNLKKAKVQVFLAGMQKYCPHLGQAASQNIWPLEHVAFADLRSFLTELIK